MKTIEFNLLDFDIKFDTESTQRNLLQEVSYDGFKLDVPELRNTHPGLYRDIKNKMHLLANNYWKANEEITGVPTLDYQAEIKKALGLAIIFLFTSFSTVFCQAHVDFGAGASNEAPVMKISAGYQLQNNLVAEAFMQPTITRKITPNFFGVKAGYNFHGLIPSVGYLYDYKSADDKQLNGWAVGYALKYQVQVTQNGGLYVEGLYARDYQFTAGFHVQF